MKPKNNNRYFEFIGAIACAIFLAYVQWLMNRESDQPLETRIFVKYIILDLSCFLTAFLIIERFRAASFIHILRSVAIALLGGISSAILIDLPFIFHSWAYSEIAKGQFFMAIQSSVIILLWDSLLTLPIMLFIYFIGLALSSIQKKITKAELI